MDTSFATICSLLPYDLIESKPGLNPNEFTLAKAEGSVPGLTIISNQIFYLVNPDPLADAKDTRFIRVPVPAMEIAQAIITDYTNALLAVEPPTAVPGLFAVAGNYSDKKEFSLKFMKEIMVCRNGQNAWFKNLVAIGDDSWSKTRSPMGIGDLQRSACRILGLQRDWLDPLPAELIDKCPVCKSQINAGALKCMNCQFVLNKVEYDKLVGAVK